MTNSAREHRERELLFRELVEVAERVLPALVQLLYCDDRSWDRLEPEDRVDVDDIVDRVKAVGEHARGCSIG